MAFLDLEDLTGRIDGVLFPNQYEQFKDQIQVGKPIKVTGTVETIEGEENYTYKIIIQKVDELIIRRVSNPIYNLEIPLEKMESLEKLKNYKGEDYKYRLFLVTKGGEKFKTKTLLSLSKDKDFLKKVLL
jgi:DNA polymerase III alpha subunit